MTLLPMTVGIPQEVKAGEYRVAGLPEHVRGLRQIGSREVFISRRPVAQAYQGSGLRVKGHLYLSVGQADPRSHFLPFARSIGTQGSGASG